MLTLSELLPTMSPAQRKWAEACQKIGRSDEWIALFYQASTAGLNPLVWATIPDLQAMLTKPTEDEVMDNVNQTCIES